MLLILSTPFIFCDHEANNKPTNNNGDSKINHITTIHKLAIISKEGDTVADTWDPVQHASNVVHTLLNYFVCSEEVFFCVRNKICLVATLSRRVKSDEEKKKFRSKLQNRGRDMQSTQFVRC